jgi:Short C-terminal domain
MFMRRRPLMRAAVVGGTAYYAGKKVQQGREQDAETEARLQQLEAEQAAGQQQAYAAPPAAAAGAGGLSEESMEQLQKLAQLHEQGILTDAEFEVQKQKILQGM